MAIPACQVAIFYFLYVVAFKVTIPHYLVFLMTGLLPWVFFSATLSESMESIAGNGNLLNQMPIPVQVFPNMSAITNMTNLLAAFPIIILVYIFSGMTFHWGLLLVFPLLAGLYFTALSIGIVFSIGFVFFRDLRHVTSLILQIWLYATPVVYTAEMVPERIAKYLFIANPVAGFFIVFRSAIFDSGISMRYLAVFAGWTIVSMLSAFVVLRKFGSGVVEKL